MRTAKQVAQNTLDAHAIKPHWQRSGTQVAELIAEAIEADRAQRSVPEAASAYRNGFDNEIAAGIYDCLTERETESADRAAEWVAENENGQFWDRFVGPMLDAIEQECGA